jgi:hypothetical protein
MVRDILELVDLFACKTQSLPPDRFLRAYRASESALTDEALSDGLQVVLAWFEDVQQILGRKGKASHG